MKPTPTRPAGPRESGRAFEEALRGVLDRPLAWGVLESPYRLHRLKRFPYGILYEPREEEVVIVAVMQLHQRPGYWRHRDGV